MLEYDLKIVSYLFVRVCECVRAGTAPSCSCLQTHRAAHLLNAVYVLQGFFLPLQSRRTHRLCLASTSQRSTGVTTAAASARPSPPAPGSRTAADMRRRSGSVLGMNSPIHSQQGHTWWCYLLIVPVWDWRLKCVSDVLNRRYKDSHSVCTLGLCCSRLSEDRVGDICNACVLLVKRWKKLPNGSKKNWNHVSHRYCN